MSQEYASFSRSIVTWCNKEVNRSFFLALLLLVHVRAPGTRFPGSVSGTCVALPRFPRSLGYCLCSVSGVRPRGTRKRGRRRNRRYRRSGRYGLYIDHNATGPKHADCAQTCIKMGLPIGIKANDGKTYLLIGEHKPINSELASLAAKTITVKGKLVSRDGFKMIENVEIVKK